MHAQILHPAIQKSRFDQIESQAATSSEPPPTASALTHSFILILDAS